jgi:hypothetical protein
MPCFRHSGQSWNPVISIEATVRREYDTLHSHVGFQFRNGYRVYVRKPGRIELVGPKNARGRGFTRNRSTHKPLKFKIIVVGPVCNSLRI